MTFSSIPRIVYHFTPQEKKIAYEIVHGKTNKQIASILGISYNTLKNKVVQMQSDLGAKNRADFVRVLLQEKRRLWDEDMDKDILQ